MAKKKKRKSAKTAPPRPPTKPIQNDDPPSPDLRLFEPAEVELPPLVEARDELAELPEAKSETWQADIRRLRKAVEIDGMKTRPWLTLVVGCDEEDEMLALDLWLERPSDDELAGTVIEAMLTPKTGDPRRPETLLVSTKKRCRGWTSALADFDVGCLYHKPLEHIDRLLDRIEPLLLEHCTGTVPSGDADEAADMSQLPQEPGLIWQADILHMPTWVEAEGAPTRPWMILVTDRTNDLILDHQLVMQQPNPDALWTRLCRTMHTSPLGRSVRPIEVQVRSEDHRSALGPLLEEIGVRCVASEELDQLDSACADMAEHVFSAPQMPALIDVPGITAEQVGGYFDAAARFFQQAPWRWVPGDTPIQVQCEKYESGPWYAVVMGQSAVTMGLALYDDLDALRMLLSGETSDQEAFRHTSAISVTFDEEFHLAIADLEAAEQFGWPVASPRAYPSAMRVNPGRTVRPPLAWELELLEGCLRAIPDYLAHPRSTPTRIEVPVAAGSLDLLLSWPAEVQ